MADVPSAGGVGHDGNRRSLRTVGDEIRNVEEKILRLEEEVLKAENRIEAIEREVLETEDRKEIDHLRQKEHDLRQDKLALRQKEHDLRQKEHDLRQEKQALNSTGELNLLEWLNQSLYRPEFKFGNRPTINHRARDWPKSFFLWNIRGEAASFCLSFLGDTKGYPKVEITFPVMTENEAVSSAVMKSLLDALTSVPITPGFRVSLQDTARLMESHPQVSTSSLSVHEIQATRQASNASGSWGFLDLGCESDARKLFYIVEMKRASLFRDQEMDPLPQLLDVLDGFHSGRFRSGRERCMAQSIGQLFTYMVAKSIGFGALSTSDVTYFIQRLVDNIICVSEGFHWEDSDFLKTLAYTIHCGFVDSNCYNTDGVMKRHFSSPTPPSSPSRPKSISDPTSESSTGNSHVDESSNLQDSRKRTANSVDSYGFRACQVSMDCILKETRAEDLHMEDEPFAYGWSGNVLKGVYNGVPVAIKLAPCNSERAEALVNEAHIYLKMQALWGVYIPHLVVWGSTVQGRVVFIATQFISGFEIGSGPTSLEVGWAVIEALEAVHNCGILHGDIRTSNIMVLSDGVRLLDFGFSRSIRRGSYSDDAADEIRQLKNLLGWSSTDGLSQDIPTTGALPCTPLGITC